MTSKTGSCVTNLMTGDKEINPNFYRSPQGVVYEKNPKPVYPEVVAVFLLSSHDTSWLYRREDGSYYWHHHRKEKEDVLIDANELQLDLFGKPKLTKKFIMDEIL